MANIINAITTGLGGLSTTADTSGNVSIQSNGTTVAAFTSAGLDVTGSLTQNGSVSVITVPHSPNQKYLTPFLY